jgi:hypothetical protein
MIGHSGYTLLEYARFNGEIMMAYVGRALLTFFPNLEALNLKNYVATNAPLVLSNWFMGYGMGVIYIVVILILTSWIFSRRSFDNA